jgi:hypothetical protein
LLRNDFSDSRLAANSVFVDKNPSSWWCALAVLPCAAGFAIGLGMLLWNMFQGFARIDKELVQVVVPVRPISNSTDLATKQFFLRNRV